MLFTAETLFGLGFGTVLRLGLGCSILAEVSLNLLLRVIKTSFFATLLFWFFSQNERGLLFRLSGVFLVTRLFYFFSFNGHIAPFYDFI